MKRIKALSIAAVLLVSVLFSACSGINAEKAKDVVSSAIGGDKCLTVTAADNSPLLLADNKAMKDASTRLGCDGVDDMTNITKSWLPSDIDKKDGEHNGQNYFAYTFYLKNTADSDVSYSSQMTIGKSTKSIDEAVRIMVVRNGVEQVYAKGQKINPVEAETDATKWSDDSSVFSESGISLGAGAQDKYTVVMWVEGNDNDALDSIRGGEISTTMKFDVAN